jgi:hypothetical protein
MSAGLTFNNDPTLKEALLAEGRHHLEADMLVKATYGDGEGDDFKGCSIGCYFKGDHRKSLTDFQISPRVTYFADTMFEQLPDPANKLWHVEWVNAIPIGASKKQIDLVMDKLQLLVLRQKAEWYGEKYNQHILIMANLFERATKGDEPSEDKWNAAARAAWAAWEEDLSKFSLRVREAYLSEMADLHLEVQQVQS